MKEGELNRSHFEQDSLLKDTLLKYRHKEKVRGRRGSRRKQLLDGFKKTRGYWKLQVEALDRTL